MDNMSEDISRYQVHPANGSTLALRISRKGLFAGNRHVLYFDKFFGEIEYDQERPEQSKLNFVIASHSITCKDDWLTSRQRKEVVSFALNKMLAAHRYPEIKFSSTFTIKVAINQYEMRGDLTIRGMTRPVVLQVITKLRPEHLEVDGVAIIRMKDYGIEPPSSLLGLSGTKNKMKLRFLVWAERATAEDPRSVN